MRGYRETGYQCVCACVGSAGWPQLMSSPSKNAFFTRERVSLRAELAGKGRSLGAQGGSKGEGGAVSFLGACVCACVRPEYGRWSRRTR